MPNTEATRLPSSIANKADFYSLLCTQLQALLEGERSWITNLSNASALLFWAFRDSETWGQGEGAVNWCGFYLDSRLFPPSPAGTTTSSGEEKLKSAGKTILKLGPFQGRPACLLIPARPGGGLCSACCLQHQPVLVPDVHAYPGHIPCDGETNSEVVVPLLLGNRILGVLDLDCLRIAGFEQEDVRGLERVAEIVVGGCDWPEGR
ncbi:GAF domain-like protein [Dacryopinax primogenitus]|uniref:GAF domain-like protein n=1 Tax=Dacryopinax primogenitus (strain DJM 731) TaxID=1858805 RepID=M5FVK0_DACPD|nr:GAF domain-like protein [Dacryopinax primogenitus]EJU01846.1 GAF domain-like protein [Dacryopinax primogenitus]